MGILISPGNCKGIVLEYHLLTDNLRLFMEVFIGRESSEAPVDQERVIRATIPAEQLRRKTGDILY